MTQRTSQRARLREMLSSRSNRPILAVNINDQQDLSAAIEAAHEAQLPIILMASVRAIEHSGLAAIIHLFRSATENSSVPAWMQLDHARDLSLIKQCVAVGFDIVMADFSQDQAEKNVRSVREVVGLARAADVLVEGEVSAIPDEGDEDGPRNHLTSPGEAGDFASKTGVDLLAVSVGNSHGFARRKPRLDTELIRAIAGATATPLVLHGGDYHSREAIARAVGAGMTKINFGPELREAYCAGLRSAVDACDLHAPDHRPILSAARAAVRAAILRRFSDITAKEDDPGPSQPT